MITAQTNIITGSTLMQAVFLKFFKNTALLWSFSHFFLFEIAFQKIFLSEKTKKLN